MTTGRMDRVRKAVIWVENQERKRQLMSEAELWVVDTLELVQAFPKIYPEGTRFTNPYNGIDFVVKNQH